MSEIAFSNLLDCREYLIPVIQWYQAVAMCGIYHKSSAAGSFIYYERAGRLWWEEFWSSGPLGSGQHWHSCSKIHLSSYDLKERFHCQGIWKLADVRNGRWEALLRKSDCPITFQRAVHESMGQTMGFSLRSRLSPGMWTRILRTWSVRGHGRTDPTSTEVSWGKVSLTNQNMPVLSYVQLSHVQLFSTLWTVARQVPLSMGSSRQGYWSELPVPPSGDLPDPGIKPTSSTSPALAGGIFTIELPGKPNHNIDPWNTHQEKLNKEKWWKRKMALERIQKHQIIEQGSGKKKKCRGNQLRIGSLDPELNLMD